MTVLYKYKYTKLYLVKIKLKRVIVDPLAWLSTKSVRQSDISDFVNLFKSILEYT